MIVGLVLMVYLFSLLSRIADSNEEMVTQLRRVADRADWSRDERPEG